MDWDRQGECAPAHTGSTAPGFAIGVPQVLPGQHPEVYNLMTITVYHLDFGNEKWKREVGFESMVSVRHNIGLGSVWCDKCFCFQCLLRQAILAMRSRDDWHLKAFQAKRERRYSGDEAEAPRGGPPQSQPSGGARRLDRGAAN